MCQGEVREIAQPSESCHAQKLPAYWRILKGELSDMPYHRWLSRPHCSSADQKGSVSSLYLRWSTGRFAAAPEPVLEPAGTLIYWGHA
jgi:hypothetical protein